MLYVRVDLHVYFMIDESIFYYVFFDVIYILLLYSILKEKHHYSDREKNKMVLINTLSLMYIYNITVTHKM